MGISIHTVANYSLFLLSCINCKIDIPLAPLEGKGSGTYWGDENKMTEISERCLSVLDDN